MQITITNKTLKIKNTKQTYEEKYFIIWAFYEFFSMLFGSEIRNVFNVSSLDNYLRIIVISLLFLLFISRRKFTKKFFLICVFLFFLIVCVEMSNLNKYFLVYTLFILNARDVDFYKFVHFDLVVKSITLIVIVFLCMFGIIGNYSAAFYNGVTKFSFGFSHPNTFTCFSLAILLEYLVFNYKTMNSIKWILNFGLFLLVYYFGRGRSSSFVYFVVFFMFLVAKLSPSFYELTAVKLIYILSFPLFSAISFIGTDLYNKGNSFVLKMDGLLTGRFYANSMFLSKYKINLFGQNLEFISSRDAVLLSRTASILDNAYVKCVLMYGTIVFVLISIGYFLLFVRLSRKKQIGLVLVAFYYIVLGIGESYMLDPVFNISLLCLINYL